MRTGYTFRVMFRNGKKEKTSRNLTSRVRHMTDEIPSRRCCDWRAASPAVEVHSELEVDECLHARVVLS
jgi:hypothetical protein